MLILILQVFISKKVYGSLGVERNILKGIVKMILKGKEINFRRPEDKVWGELKRKEEKRRQRLKFAGAFSSLLGI